MTPRLSPAINGAAFSHVGNRVPLQDVLPKPHARDVESFGPIGQRHRCALVCQELGSARVARLALLRRPSTISGFVVAVGVDSVDGVFQGWSRPHIGQEVLERVAPSLTDGDAATSISGIGAVRWVEAPSLHASPRSMFRGVAASMRRVDRQNYLAVKAPATLSPAASEIAAVNGRFSAAIAPARPSSPRFGDHNKPAKSLSGGVERGWHKGQFYHGN